MKSRHKFLALGKSTMIFFLSNSCWELKFITG